MSSSFCVPSFYPRDEIKKNNLVDDHNKMIPAKIFTPGYYNSKQQQGNVKKRTCKHFGRTERLTRVTSK